MSTEPAKHESAAVTQIKRHQFVVFIVGAILVSFFMVFVALSLYISSGTIQLDLSRPGYADARRDAQNNGERFQGFSSNGEITENSLDEFDALYKQKMDEANSVNAFSGDALSDDVLQLGG